MSPTVREEERELYHRAIFDGVPIPMFVVDEDMRIQDFNTAAEVFLGKESVAALDKLCGEVLHCVGAEQEGCGNAATCRGCAIRNSVLSAMSGSPVHRKLHIADFRTRKRAFNQEFLISANILPFAEPPRVLIVLEDVSNMLAMRKDS